MNQPIYEYKGKSYPQYLKEGNAVSHCIPFAKHFCKGNGIDIGGTPDWHLPGSLPVNIDLDNVEDAHSLPKNQSDEFGQWDYIFSSHCLEHLPDYVFALKEWQAAIRPGGQLFLYLPHPEMEYWLPQNNPRHLHMFYPADIVKTLKDLGFVDIFHGERDLYYSFCVTGTRVIEPGELG